MDEAQYIQLAQNDPAEGLRVYWIEILERAHMTAATSLLRSGRWLSGIHDSYYAGNYHLFCAAYRGLIESASDSYFTLSAVPRTLSDLAQWINRALNKTAGENFFISQELENILIHYTHARKIKKGEDVPDSHRAKHVRDYLDQISHCDDGKLQECYAELCETTHPASDSVKMFFRHDSETLILANDLDQFHLDSFCQKYVAAVPNLLALAVNPCILTLAVLNLMHIDSLRTPAINTLDLSSMNSWQELERRVKNAFKSK